MSVDGDSGIILRVTATFPIKSLWPCKIAGMADIRIKGNFTLAASYYFFFSAGKTFELNKVFCWGNI
jgi:hypothetical protein